MTDDERVEILAQAMWMGNFGVIQIDPRWQKWAEDNPEKAKTLRDKGKEMLEFSKSYSTHSLGWLP